MIEGHWYNCKYNGPYYFKFKGPRESGGVWHEGTITALEYREDASYISNSDYLKIAEPISLEEIIQRHPSLLDKYPQLATQMKTEYHIFN